MQYTSLFQSHQSSVKSVTTNPTNKHIFATSGRDGYIYSFDTRYGPRPIHSILNAHVPKTEIGNRSSKKRKSDLINRQMNQSFTVTSVKFLDEHQLISTGAADGLVKIWDQRQFCRNTEFPTSTYSSRPISNGKRAFGMHFMHDN